MNYRLVAIELGDHFKWDTSINEIDRLARALFKFQREHFPNEAITSQRAQLIFDWIMSLAKQNMNPDERNDLLLQFTRGLCRSSGFKDEKINEIERILADANINSFHLNGEDNSLFYSRNFHPEVIKHSKSLFLEGNYFHAVFEACKAYNKTVKTRASTIKDGYELMMDVWGWEKGVLKITPCTSETDKNVQEGVKFLSAGLMRAIRNPTSHEPAIDWPIKKEDCLDILSFLSFLFRQLDKAVYFDNKVPTV
jgi:uncharacterized protein (TIGR02391 family)